MIMQLIRFYCVVFLLICGVGRLMCMTRLDSLLMQADGKAMEHAYMSVGAELPADERAELAWRTGRCMEAMNILLENIGDGTGRIGKTRLRSCVLFHMYNNVAKLDTIPGFYSDIVFEPELTASDYALYEKYVLSQFEADSTLSIVHRLGDAGLASMGRWSDSAQLCLSLAEAYLKTGEIRQACDYSDSLLAYLREMCSPSGVILPRALCVKSEICRTVGDYSAAKKSVCEALEMMLEHGNEKTAEYALMLLEYGRVLADVGQYEEAVQYYLASSEAFSRLFPSNPNPALAVKLETAQVYLLLNRADVAKKMADEYEAAETGGLEMFHDFYRLLSVRGETYLVEHLPGGAFMMFDLILQLRAGDGGGILNLTPLQLRDVLCAAGYASILDGKSEQAMEYYERQLELDRRLVHDVFMFMPESKRGTYRASMEAAANRLFCANREGTVTMDGGKVVDMPASNRNACSGLLYDASLLLKGVLQESSAGFRRMLDKPGSGEAARVASELTSLRRSMAAAGAADAATAARADSLEREFLALAGDEADFMKFADVRWQQVRDALAARQVAVEFVCAVDGGMEYYSAEVLRRGMERPQHVFLFACKEGDEPFGSDPYGSSVAYRKVWRKIAPLLKEGDEVCFSPAGQLHGVAVEYVKTPAGTRMCDVYGMRRLSSTRRLLEDGRSGGNMAAVFGGLNYNTDAELMEMYAEAYKTDGFMAMRGADTRGVERLPWQYLPGTQAEAAAVARSMRAANREVELYTGDDGMEETFKALSGRGHSALHVATHGFYNTAGRRSLNPIAAQYGGDNALDRCGLVMSGANNAWLGGRAVADGVDDGILTAHEIAEMDLTAAEVVVLSACSTGAGDVTGDGVYGLQRGFKLAGAGSIVMSLWPVADAAASLFMQEFYRSMNAGNSHHAALADGRAALMSAGYTDPEHWAAFIILD